MSRIILIFALFLSNFAFATNSDWKDFKCVFTEPFLSVLVQENRMVISSLADESQAEKVFEGTSMVLDLEQSKENFVALVKDSTGNTLLKLIEDGQGSDGMSDEIYPISGVLTALGMTLYGGCDFANK